MWVKILINFSDKIHIVLKEFCATLYNVFSFFVVGVFFKCTLPLIGLASILLFQQPLSSHDERNWLVTANTHYQRRIHIFGIEQWQSEVKKLIHNFEWISGYVYSVGRFIWKKKTKNWNLLWNWWKHKRYIKAHLMFYSVYIKVGKI